MKKFSKDGCKRNLNFMLSTNALKKLKKFTQSKLFKKRLNIKEKLRFPLVLLTNKFVFLSVLEKTIFEFFQIDLNFS